MIGEIMLCLSDRRNVAQAMGASYALAGRPVFFIEPSKKTLDPVY